MKAIVTGAASGIGKAVANMIAATAAARGETAEIIIVDRAEAELQHVAAELSSSGHRVCVGIEDLADPESAGRIAKIAASCPGGLDALICNAGVLSRAPLVELGLKEFERVFAINTRATWLLAKATYPLLKMSKGALVATSSISATHPTPPHGSYSASKAALLMLVRQMAHEWGPDGIRCNCVSPGTIHTAMTDPVYSDPAKQRERASHIPLQRIGTADDVARAIVFLAGADAAYITGVDLPVDGGLGTSLMPLLRGANVPEQKHGGEF